MASVAAGMVWLLVLASPPVGAPLAAWAAGTRWPAATLVAVVALGWELVAAPVVWWVVSRERRRTRRPVDSSTGGLIRDALTGAALTAGGVSLLLASVHLAGPGWWLLMGGASGALLVVGTVAAGLMARSRLTSRPVTRPALADRLGALSSRISGAVVPVREWVGREHDGLATVTGVGRSGAILLSHDLGAEWPEDEVVVVVAHELAHHHRHDLWRKAALDTVVATGAAGAAEWTRSAAGLPIDLSVPGGLATIPLLALVALVTWWGLRPIRLAQSRAHERAADRLSLEWTGLPEAFMSAVRRMETRHLAEQRPSRVTRWYFHKHPTVEERLSAARR